MQQATCDHSGANTGTSPGNIENFSAPSRRALLSFAAGAGALAFTGSVSASPLPATRWDVLRARFEAATRSANDFYETTYQRERDRIDAIVGESAPKWFEHTASNGHTARYAIEIEAIDPFQSSVLDPLHAEAVAAWKGWTERSERADQDPRWRSTLERIDALWTIEEGARRALIEEPALHAAALALKVQLALANDDMSDTDRAALLKDAERLA